PTELGGQPRGKQTTAPEGIMYTPTSGIWQTVWLEPVATNGISNIRIVPNPDQSAVKLTVSTTGSVSGVSIAIKVKDTGTIVATTNASPNTEISVAIPSPKLWSPNNPFLYDLEVSLVQNGNTNDMATSYFGMRKISVGNVDGAPKLLLNGQFVFEL